MKKIKNITEFTYDNSSFEGFRVQASRNGTTYRQYIARSKHGRSALKVAIRAKDALFEELDNKRNWTKAEPLFNKVAHLIPKRAQLLPKKAMLKRLKALGFAVPA